MAGREQGAAGSAVACLCHSREGAQSPSQGPWTVGLAAVASARPVCSVCAGGWRGEPGGLLMLLVGILAESVQLGMCWGPTLPSAACCCLLTCFSAPEHEAVDHHGIPGWWLRLGPGELAAWWAGGPGGLGQGQTEEVIWGLSLNLGFLWLPLLHCLGDWLFLRTQLVLRGPGPLLACAVGG